jgi:hypothetical protein
MFKTGAFQCTALKIYRFFFVFNHFCGKIFQKKELAFKEERKIASKKLGIVEI